MARENLRHPRDRYEFARLRCTQQKSETHENRHSSTIFKGRNHLVFIGDDITSPTRL